MKESQSQSTYRLTSCVLDNLKQHGSEGFKFVLNNYKIFAKKNTIDHVEFTAEETISMLWSLINCCKTYNTNTLVYLLQKNTNFIGQDYPSILKNNELVNYMFSLSEEVFDVPQYSILHLQNRDGKRIFASGTIAEHLMVFLGFTVKDTCEILKKNKSAISRHKKSITTLTHYHPTDRIVLQKYLSYRYNLVNYIINNY